MIVLACGGRKYDDTAAVFRALDAVQRKHGVELLIQGGARGADYQALLWARSRLVHCAQVDAYWEELGNAAGPLRNVAMALLKPDVVVAFPGGRGTDHMIQTASKLGIKIWRPYL